MRGAGPVPVDHDCDECGCDPEFGFHHDTAGYCLSCHGCYDWECCAHCDLGEDCRFDPRVDEPAAEV